MKIIINDIEYKIKEDNRDCFNLDEVKEKLNDTDYFNTYDYILGDYSYEKLRLKGFYNKNNKNAKKINSIEYVNDYIKDYCSYGCKYFILEKVTSEKSK